MKFYWNVQKKSAYTAAIDLKKAIPELSKVNTEYIESHLRGCKMEFYYKEKKPKPIWIRLTLPFGFVVMLTLFILLPINYIITGRWSYRWKWLANWFRMLGF